MRTAVVVVLSLLLELVASAQQPGNVWTDADLKKPIRATRHRQVTETEMAGIRERAYVAPPVWPAGPQSYSIPWTPDDDRPDRGRLPVWWHYDDIVGRRYAEQPYYPSWFWYPQTRIIVPGQRRQLPPRSRR